MDIDLRVLGPAEILVDGRPAVLQGGRTRGLLAALLLHEGRVVPAAELIALIWDGDAPKTAANQLQIAVHRLRTALSAAGLDGRLGTRDGGYALDLPAGTRADLHDFRALAAEAADRAAAGDWTAARDTGRAALALWRGPAWADLGADGPRRAAETERLTAVELTQTAELVLGERAAPVAELRALVAEHPYHQRFWHLLVLALALSGRPAEALETHAAARERHQRELGAGLGPELAELERAVLRGELQDALDAVRGWASERAETTPPRSPGGLPADIGDFIGRAAEGDHVAGILRANPTHRDPAVVVIAGLGGIGKTTFAVRTARRNAGLFPDGCLFVDLRGFDDTPKAAHAVMGDLLHALGVAGQAVPDDPDARLGVYRSVMAGRQVLLVLDNAASEAQVRPLLPVHAASAALVTSRRLLAGLDGAFVVELDVLSPPEALGMLTGIHRDGGRGTDPAALDRIAELTGRHPFALRILGSRTARMCGGDLGEVLSRLSDEKARLDELSEGDGRVRRSIGFSYTDLGPSAARLLRLAALLPTPRFGAEIAAGLLGTDLFDAEEALDELTDAQLLRPVEGAAGVRYVMHDLVRLYAREQGEGEGPLEAAYGLLLALAHHADDALGYRYYPTPALADWAPEPEPDSLAAVRADPAGWFEEERELLFAVIGEAAEPAVAWRLLAATVNFADLRGHSHDGIALLETTLARVGDLPDRDHAHAALHLAATRAARSTGRFHDAVRSAGKARRAYLRLGDPVRAGAAAVQFAESIRVLGHRTAAFTAYEHAFALLAPHVPTDRTAVAQTGWAHKELAVLRLYARGAEAALRSFVDGHPFMVDAGDRAGEARTLGGQGLMNLRLGNLREGIAQAEAAALLLDRAGDRVEEVFVRVELAEAYQRDGRPGQAVAAIERAVAETRGLRLDARTSTALHVQGRILRAQGHGRAAIELFEEALRMVGEHQPVTRARLMADLAETHLAAGAHALARGYAEQAGAAERNGYDVTGLLARIAATGSS